MLRITLKILISFNNSEKYRSNKTRDANKETIESFLQQEKKSLIIKILSMTLEEWIIFLLLKRIVIIILNIIDCYIVQ
jgi:hypothetical protein